MGTLIWLGIVLLLIILEMISMGLTTIWFAGGALVAAVVSTFGGPLWLQIILFIVVSLVLIFTTRPIAKKHLNTKVEKTNAESLIGKKVQVVETIDNRNSTGKIKVNDVEWTARSSESSVVIQSGSEVIIREISGVKCIVELIAERK